MSAAVDKTGPISIDDDLEFLNEQIEALKELGRLDEVSEGQLYDFSIRWGAALSGRLRRLVYFSSGGMLDEAGESRFQSLCAELRSVSDLIERFDVARPRLSDVPNHPKLR